jgi:spore maturation protein CgeB
MRLVMFCHSLASCWNHGNVHFLRGIARELVRRGDQVVVYEPADGWSRSNLVEQHGPSALEAGAQVVPGVDLRTYEAVILDLDRALEDADVVLVHEWTEAELVARIGKRRIDGGRFLLLFHDTHHRALTAPQEIGRLNLDGYDAVLAFGEVLRQVYVARGWGRRVFTWHEAADTVLFEPDPDARKDTDLIWIGNWGDGERDEELRTFLVGPACRLGLTTRLHGVRYPPGLREELAAHRIRYEGWLANHCVPAAFARARFTMHVPRRPYVEALPGIPTIRMFEALACGTPLVTTPWSDVEHLFPPGAYVTARSEQEMAKVLGRLRDDPEFSAELAATGRRTILERHTCRHRLNELDAILAGLGAANGDGKPVHLFQAAVAAGP